MDNPELQEVMEILEEMENEQLAASLLSELNEKSSKLGKLLLNQDPTLSHEKWKELCDNAQNEVDAIIEKIRQEA